MTEEQGTPSDEVWKDIPGWEGWYQVSDRGRIRRIAPNGKHGPDGILPLCIGARGYIRATLSGNGRQISCRVHVQVVRAFIEEIPEGKQVNHKDGIKANCRLDNLEIATPKENTNHAYRMGLIQNFGELHPGTKFPDSLVAEIRRAHSEGGKQARQRELARRFGVSKTQVARIVNRKSRTRGTGKRKG
jgi:NUMOD4 motif/HNH endonuclease/CENP-B N-terminal DNA-binding domain